MIDQTAVSPRPIPPTGLATTGGFAGAGGVPASPASAVPSRVVCSAAIDSCKQSANVCVSFFEISGSSPRESCAAAPVSVISASIFTTVASSVEPGSSHDVTFNSKGTRGYSAALTCDFGRVKRGSDPLKMKRLVIDKRMDFAEFRKYMGASSMQLADMTPLSGGAIDGPATVVSARIPNYESLDPQTVGMALMSLGSIARYSYDARTGSISLLLDDAAQMIKGKY